ncbi:acetyl-CoA acetyltransferase [Paraburkholderia sediminicola]|uniref:acetyl-CoA acetyltransferase n=1 Tax=Paraburkholderia sediminicola TaxID=458836 RepID=UPI0038BB67B1
MPYNSPHLTLSLSRDPARTPVIVGVGEIVDRPETIERALEPAQLITEALWRADGDTSGKSLLAQVDSLHVVNSVTCRYDDLPGRVASLAQLRPRRAVHGPLGGESPVRLLHEAAIRIAQGENDVAVVCGAEAGYTRYQASRAGYILPWPEADDGWLDLLAEHSPHHARALGVAQPSTVYPFFENAFQAAHKQTPAYGMRQSAQLWSEYAEIASQNPCAWLRRHVTPDEIATPSPANRMVAWPYPKLMMANPTVNQGAAVLITSLAKAREAHIPAARTVYFWTGASAVEPRNYLERDQYARSPAMEAVLDRCISEITSTGKTAKLMELYSCFPCVPKMVLQVLRSSNAHAPSVTGGLTFFGAPLNNYMTHAACEMVRRIRKNSNQPGLLYGQGEFVTKHHGLVLGGVPPDSIILPATHSVQASADARRGEVPAIATFAKGPASIETHTVLYERDATLRHGVVIVRTATGERALARVAAHDLSTLDLLTNLEQSPIGTIGSIGPASDGILEWSVPK